MRISNMQIMNNLIQIGLTVSLAALVPLLLRRVLKKRYPARAVCLVWALLALRLLVPVQLTLPEAPVRVTPRTNYVMQDDRMLFEQAGLPVEQTPARWVTDEQAAALSHANTSQTTTFNLTAVLLGLCKICVKLLAGGINGAGVPLVLCGNLVSVLCHFHFSILYSLNFGDARRENSERDHA